MPFDFIQIFVKDNQTGTDITRIDQLALHGVPISATNMGDFKRVSDIFPKTWLFV